MRTMWIEAWRLSKRQSVEESERSMNVRYQESSNDAQSHFAKPSRVMVQTRDGMPTSGPDMRLRNAPQFRE